MTSARKFEELHVWQKARALAKLVYRFTSKPTFNRDVRLRYQMRDCSVSIMANIAEGYSRKSDRDFRRFLLISKGSGSELKSHSFVALDQSYFTQNEFDNLFAETDFVTSMLANLVHYLSRSINGRGQRTEDKGRA